MTFKIQSDQIKKGDEDLEKLAEEEYIKLQGKFRLSEISTTQYPTRLKAVLKKQERVIDILKKEKEELSTCVNVTTSKGYKELETKGLTNVYNRIEQEKQLDDEIAKEKSNIRDLQTEIDKVKKEVINFNKTDIHESKITESKLKSLQRVAGYENNLQIVTNQFNEMLKQNVAYRKEIETLLTERKIFFKFYMQLHKQLVRGKQIMLDLVEQATMTHDQKEETLNKLKSLKVKSAAEKRIQSEDVEELRAKLDNTEDLFEFLSVKGQKRILADLEATEARETKRQKDEYEDKLQSYMTLLNKIRNLSDEKDIDKFVTSFNRTEAETLGLFNYINEVNNEVEVLQSQITTLLDQIDDQRELNETRAREQLEVLAGLAEQVNEKEEKYNIASTRLQASETLLNDLLDNVEKMFHEYECDSRPLVALLGNNAHVNVYNVKLCLTLLEKQLYEFIYIAYAKERHATPDDLIHGNIVQEDYHLVAAKRKLIYHIASSSPCPLCVETDRIFVLDENNATDMLEQYEDVYKQLLEKVGGTEHSTMLHNISTCRLPRSRAIMQARFQEHDKEGY